MAKSSPANPPATQGPAAPGTTAAAPATPTPAAPPPAAAPSAAPRVTRAGVVWAAVVAALVLLILLIIFILQNQEQVAVRYLGLEGSVPLGMALFIASVTGGVLVAIAGGARILQLRYNAHRSRLGQTRS
ncbi:LapA family protein [Arthrobacter sp. ISL-48]|nr:LapA family protein [Arthrobacter sp. ISL-48]